ncbi:hypothetical protein C7S13_7801 [Burkholderia cepacia]|nr:hypothetical protein [Burkholderia cepacia]
MARCNRSSAMTVRLRTTPARHANKNDKSEQMGAVFPPTIRACFARSRTTARSADASPAFRCA